MRKLLLLFLLVPAWAAAADAPRLIYLVRHAERADDGTDSDLSSQGFERAQRLADFLRHVPVQAIYATNYQRTQKTVAPLAAAKGLTTRVLSADKTEALAGELRESSAGVVVVAGHSNTIPQLIEQLGGGQVVIGHGDYDNVFLLILTGDSSTLQRFHFTLE